MGSRAGRSRLRQADGGRLHRGREAVREELVAGQRARFDERLARGVDHRGAAARIDLIARQIGEIVENRLVDEAPAARPCGVGLGQHRDIREVRARLLPLARQVGQVEIANRPHAPVQDHRSRLIDLVVERMLDDAFDRREAGTAGDEDDRLVRLLAQEERAERPFEAQDLAPLELREQLIGKPSAGKVADVQFEQRVVVRRIRKREAAAATVFQQEVDVLPGEELQPLVRGQLELDDRHIGGRLVDRFDAARQLANADVACLAHLPHLDHEVGQRLRAAEQREPQRFSASVSVDA